MNRTMPEPTSATRTRVANEALRISRKVGNMGALPGCREMPCDGSDATPRLANHPNRIGGRRESPADAGPDDHTRERGRCAGGKALLPSGRPQGP